MISSFPQLNEHLTRSVLITSQNIIDRSNLLLDLIKQTPAQRIYIVCDYKPTLSDKIEEICNKNIFYIEANDTNLYYLKDCLVVFYEACSYQVSEIKRVVNNNQVIVSSRPKEFLSPEWLGLLKVSIDKVENQFLLKVMQREVCWVVTTEKPSGYREFCYYMENATIRKILSSYFGVSVYKNIKLINYFPSSEDIFNTPNNFREYLKNNGISSFKIYQKLIQKTIQEKDSVIVFNFAYILILNNFISAYGKGSVNLDVLNKILDLDFAHHQFRSPKYTFFKVFPQAKIAKFLRKSNLKELYLIEAIESDFNLFALQTSGKINPHKIKTFKHLKEQIDFITYKALDNKQLPVNKIHQAQLSDISSPKDLHELYEMKFFFKNCITLYLENILQNRSIFAKVKHNEEWFCVSLDANYKIHDIKKTMNQEVSKDEMNSIQQLIDTRILGKKSLWQKVCGLL